MGYQPLIPIKLAFLFLLSRFSFLHAKLLVSFCSFLLCRLTFQINESRRCALQSRGLSTLSLLPPSDSLPKRPSLCASALVVTSRKSPPRQSQDNHAETRLSVTSSFLSSNSLFFIFQSSCSLLLEARDGGSPRSPQGRLCVSLWSLLIGLELELQ